MDPKLKVAVVGAGIAGLMLACCIGKMDKRKRIELDIYEATAALAEIGAGIVLSRSVFDMLAKIGLEEDLLKYGERGKNGDSSPVFKCRKSDQKNGHPILDMYTEGGIFRIHRADLQRVLLKSTLTHARLRLSSRLVSYTEHPDGVSLEFMDGSKRMCDLLVGADGLKSTVRRLFLASRPGQEPSIEPVWTGTYAYRGLVPSDTLLKMMPGHQATRVPTAYLGKLKKIVAYPVSKGAFINVVAMVHDETREETRHEGPWFESVSNAEVLSVYQGFEPEVQALFECMPNPSKWAIHHLIPLKTHAEGRVVLLGDAAHATGPHLAAGAGQAMEDAYILSRILSDTNTTNLRSQIRLIAQSYDAIRRPIGNAAITLTKKCGKLDELTDDEMELPFVKAHDDKVPHEVLLAYINKSERNKKHFRDISGGVEEQSQNALELLQGLTKPNLKSKM